LELWREEGLLGVVEGGGMLEGISEVGRLEFWLKIYETEWSRLIFWGG
jgi:hypothetical protein